MLCYDGIGHGAIYVGGGYIIHAPRTGMYVQKIPMNASWYESTFVGVAGRAPACVPGSARRD